ncbi:MAG TPA: hypothetical protein VI876_07545 [Dehalococcoidia bacterium]|nr:hypothetical protein [Dehalococcoidia bacterium]
MIEPTSPPAPLAVHCQYLWRTVSADRREPASICTHPVRDGRDCIGPFLEDLATACGLWEEHPDSHLIPLPQPERWQRRRRRQGYDLHAGHGSWGVDWR